MIAYSHMFRENICSRRYYSKLSHEKVNDQRFALELALKPTRMDCRMKCNTYSHHQPTLISNYICSCSSSLKPLLSADDTNLMSDFRSTSVAMTLHLGSSAL